MLIQLRKERGLDSRSFLSMESLRNLRVQSGLTMPMPKYFSITSGVALAVVLVGFFYGLPLLFALAIFPFLCIIIPVQVLKFRRNRRHKIFGVQLPEALELITRSLKAGHPVPVAISMVSREMPDPIGTEFGVVADEVTYGSDLVSALHNLYERVGQEDLPLFVTAVSIQSSSGGNLREILDGLSLTIRDRGKLKRKVQGNLDRGPHVGLHPDRGALPARRRDHGADAAFLHERVGRADDMDPARQLLRVADARQRDDVQDVEFQVLTWNS